MEQFRCKIHHCIVPTKHTLVYEWDIYKCRLCTNKLANKIAIFF